MKTIVTLIFLGYLGCTFACYDSMPTPKCQDLDSKAKFPFSTDSFFSRDWYVTHSKNQAGTIECSKFETSKTGKINLKYQSGGQNVKCTGDSNSLKKYICFDCEGSKNNKFNKFFLVLETDSYYADYALVYVCNQSGTTTNDNFLVLQRHKSKDLPSGINSILSKVQLKPNDLKSNNCK
ncbi:triplatin-like isoform X2 [Rhodnius prolixus]|uniref:triplatin-like isoform X2 n=1 Tax=Rhodnius prolixus TaxID=13249 RepID=UPI003D189852